MLWSGLHGGAGRRRPREDDTPTILRKPMSQQSDTPIIKQALELDHLDIPQWINKLNLDELEALASTLDKQTGGNFEHNSKETLMFYENYKALEEQCNKTAEFIVQK